MNGQIWSAEVKMCKYFGMEGVNLSHKRQGGNLVISHLTLVCFGSQNCIYFGTRGVLIRNIKYRVNYVHHTTTCRVGAY
jgi:hypothetical protein